MRHFIYTSVFIFIFFMLGHAQNEYTHYGSIDPHAATSGLPFFDRGMIILSEGDHLFIVSGYVKLEGGRSCHLIKVDMSDMSVVDIIPLEGPQGDNAFVEGCVAPDGGLVFTGEWLDYEIGRMRTFLAKYNTDLELQWINYFPEPDSTGIGYFPMDVCNTFDGGYFIYYVESRAVGNPKRQTAWLLKTDENGERLFQKMIPDTFAVSRVRGNITPTDDGHYFVTGYGRNSEYFSQAYKIDEDGEIIWYQPSHIGQLFDDQRPYSTRLPGGGGVHAWMHDTIILEIYPQLGRHFNMLKGYDTDGNLVWRHIWLDRNIVNSGIYHLSPASNGDIIGTGYMQIRPSPFLYFGAWVFRMDPQGHQKWERFYNDSLVRPWPPGYFIPFRNTELTDGRIAITGIIVDSTDHPDLPLGFQANVLLMVLDSMGCLVPGCEGDEQIITAVREPLIIDRYSVSRLSVSPNPASDMIEVRLQEGLVTPYEAMMLECRDMHGRQLYRALWQNTTSHTQTMDVRNWPPGAYVLTLRTGSGLVAAGRVVVAR
ncbi:MAG: T9SS type A sorting domain-containing protein [Saprospiraceae bacterium]|nr:T9SS type A sorting domain-containing protein [Saprospiraceae bacterium]